MRSMIKAVIFDMGGVVVNLDGGICISNFKSLAGFDTITDYLDLFHQKGFISDLEEGLITVDEFYAECFKHCRPGTTPDIIDTCFRSLLTGLKPATVALLKELKPDYDLFILSNNNPIARAKFEELLEEEGIVGAEFFKKEFYSYEMRLLKPSKEIFERAVREIGVKPGEALFIDDSKSNAEGARAAGLTTIWLTPGMDIRAAVMEVLKP